MTNKIFKEGGPHNIQRTGSDEYTMNVSIPKDADGTTARECPNDECSPGYFKVKGGTGITDGQEVAYCPYCRYEEEPNGFTSEEQIRNAKAKNWTSMFWKHPKAGGPTLPLMPLSGIKSDFNVEKWPPKRAHRHD